MANWYPLATQIKGNSSGSLIAGYAKKGVIHTTEGSTAAGAFNAYRNHNSWPHFTIGPNGKVYQHLSIGVAARTLENRTGGVETNRGGAIQFEVVGFAKNTNWPTAQVIAVKALMRWIEENAGIKPYGPVFGGGGEYGYFNPLQFSPSQWIQFNGWCGHQHVPENAHWDPGAINLNVFLEPVPPAPIPQPPVSVDIGPEEPVQRRTIGPFKLDGNGNGWIGLPDIPFESFRNVHVQGSYPPVDGYWPLPKVGVQQRVGTVIEIAEGKPNQSLIIFVDHI